MDLKDGDNASMARRHDGTGLPVLRALAGENGLAGAQLLGLLRQPFLQREIGGFCFGVEVGVTSWSSHGVRSVGDSITHAGTGGSCEHGTTRGDAQPDSTSSDSSAEASNFIGLLLQGGGALPVNGGDAFGLLRGPFGPLVLLRRHARLPRALGVG